MANIQFMLLDDDDVDLINKAKGKDKPKKDNPGQAKKGDLVAVIDKPEKKIRMILTRSLDGITVHDEWVEVPLTTLYLEEP